MKHTMMLTRRMPAVIGLVALVLAWGCGENGMPAPSAATGGAPAGAAGDAASDTSQETAVAAMEAAAIAETDTAPAANATEVDTAAPALAASPEEVREPRQDTPQQPDPRRNFPDVRASLDEEPSVLASRNPTDEQSREERVAIETEPENYGPQVVFAEPAVLNLGRVAAGEPAKAAFTLVNRGGESVRFIDAKGNCGCTTPNVTNLRGQMLSPGAPVEIEVQVTPPNGMQAGMPLNKKVTVKIEGQRDIVVDVQAEVFAYVEVEPRLFTPENIGDGRFVIKAMDEAPFRIERMQPPLIEEFDSEPKTEHVLELPFDRWEEVGGNRTKQMVFMIDHPKVKTVTAYYRPAPTEAAQRQAEAAMSQLDPTTRLIAAARRGDLDAVETAIQAGETDINAVDSRTNETALIGAVKLGHVEVVRALLDAGASVDTADARGQSPLIHAALTPPDRASSVARKLQVMQILIDAGADVNARDFMDGTALLWAAGPLGHTEALRVLLKANAEVDVVDSMGMTPLIWASGFGSDPKDADAYLARVRLLVEAGADTEIYGGVEGMTALLYAAQRSPSVEIVQALLDAGADINATTPTRQNALDLAKTRPDEIGVQIVALLKERGLKPTPPAEPTPAPAPETPDQE